MCLVDVDTVHRKNKISAFIRTGGSAVLNSQIAVLESGICPAFNTVITF